MSQSQEYPQNYYSIDENMSQFCSVDVPETLLRRDVKFLKLSVFLGYNAMMSRLRILAYSTAFIHALLTLYFFYAALLAFAGGYYTLHLMSHIVWTILLISVFIIQKIYKGCPITYLEKSILEKEYGMPEQGYGKSFVGYWVHRLTGIRLPLNAVYTVMYLYLMVMIYSWFVVI